MNLSPEDKMLILASTIYFQAKWSDAFDKGNNTTDIFHSAEGDISCTFMNQKLAEMNYYWAKDDGYFLDSLLSCAPRMQKGIE